MAMSDRITEAREALTEFEDVYGAATFKWTRRIREAVRALIEPPTEVYKGWHLATWDGDKQTTCTCSLTSDHPIEQTTIAIEPPTADGREALVAALRRPVWDAPRRPAETQAPFVAEAVFAAGFRRPAPAGQQGPVTDAEVEAAASAWWLAGGQGNEILAPMRAALEAAREVRNAD